MEDINRKPVIYMAGYYGYEDEFVKKTSEYINQYDFIYNKIFNKL